MPKGEATGLGIICAAGQLPLTVAAAAVARGRTVFIVGLEGWADPGIAAYPHAFVRIGRIGVILRKLAEAGCREVVMIGSLDRPSPLDLLSALDPKTLVLAPRIVRGMRGGDDRMLSAVTRLLEEHGFLVRGAHEVAPEILAPEGVFGRVAPTPEEQDDALLAQRIVAALGPFDVGQAVVVHRRRVLAIEAAEGTDGVLERLAALRAAGRLRIPARAGVLMKAPKPGQNLKVDMPAIGPRTVAGAAAAGLAGIAVVGHHAVVAEADALVQAADAAGLFVVGLPARLAQENAADG
jgi:hypothetical protein